MYSVYHSLTMPEPDALYAVMERLKLDKREHKIDLGVGIYRDDNGRAPIMAAIKKAELVLHQQEDSKMYLGLDGVAAFITGMTHLLFPKGIDNRVAAIQTVGGTGGVRLAIECMASANPGMTVYVGTPTWPNHINICQALNVKVVTYPYLKSSVAFVDYDRIINVIENASPGDMLILHGPCHNPTGEDISEEAFLDLINLSVKQGVVPLIDAAYYGMGAELDSDLALLNRALSACQNAFLVMSCSKAFGLYRERVGALLAVTESHPIRNKVQALLEKIARSSYSAPPAHGAHAVARVLGNKQLLSTWQQELNGMRNRILGVREELYSLGKGNIIFKHIARQKGIFSLLPMSPSSIDKLAQDHAIYMPSSGRVNLAGLKKGDVERFVWAVKSVDKQ